MVLLFRFSATWQGTDYADINGTMIRTNNPAGQRTTASHTARS